jgi:hypothetical protein
LFSIGVNDPGILRLGISSIPSVSPFCISMTGKVMVSKNTLGAAIIPKNFSQMFLSCQLYSVGNSVEMSVRGGGRIL